MRTICLIFGTVVAIWFVSGTVCAQEKDPDYCGPSDMKLAHCDGHIPTFRSLILVIPGWNGSCKTTFGEDRAENIGGTLYGSIYTFLRGKRFFDLDCFGYDSHNLDIDQIADLLGERIDTLHRNKSYDEILLITHSTGGIVALKFLNSRLQKAIELLRITDLAGRNQKYADMVRIPSLLAWATPINGIYDTSKVWVWVKDVFGDEKAASQLNNESSNYLENVRANLANYRHNLSQLPPENQQRFDVQIVFYQGQGDDKIVRPIVEAKARKEGWLWDEPHARLINIEVGHLSAISDSGSPYIQKYPGAMIEDEALVNLSFNIELNSVFPLGRNNYNSALLPYQQIAVDGSAYHAARFHNYPTEPFISFLRRVLLKNFPRDKNVDYRLLERLENNVFRDKILDKNVYTRPAARDFINKVIAAFNPAVAKAETSPGHGEAEFANKLLKFATNMNEALKRLTPSTISYKKEQENLTNFILKGFNSPQQSVQETTGRLLASLIKNTPDDILNSTEFVTKVADYYSPRSSMLGGKIKEQIGLTFVELASRESVLGTNASSFLNKKLSFGSIEVPAWKTFQSDKVDRELLINYRTQIQGYSLGEEKSLDASAYNQFAERAITLGSMSAWAGSKGNDPYVVKEGYEAGKKYFQLLPENEQVKVLVETFSYPQAARYQAYPTLQEKFSPNNWITDQ